MDPAHRQLLDRITAASTLEDVERAREDFEASMPAPVDASLRNAFVQQLAAAAHGHLAGGSRHPAYRRWIDTYFGRAPCAYRSPLQQPSYLYYPSLDPVPWFETHDITPLRQLLPAVAGVAEELRSLLSSRPVLQPYVAAEAARDGRWSVLAASSAWSSLHLVRGGAREERLLARLPLTSAMLCAAPLAECPPHAPECFLSRLLPGVRIPPHFGLSNIKLTVHLPVELPREGCTITVAGVTRQWRMGEFMVFDDSFEHSAANLSQVERTVLIFDIWQPGLDPEERAALAHAIRVLEQMQGILNRLA